MQIPNGGKFTNKKQETLTRKKVGGHHVLTWYSPVGEVLDTRHIDRGQNAEYREAQIIDVFFA